MDTNQVSITSTFTATPGVYAIVGNSMALQDQISARTNQLNAMLAVTYGEVGESFRMLADDIQDSYMYACSQISLEIAQLKKVMDEYGDDAAFVFANQNKKAST